MISVIDLLKLPSMKEGYIAAGGSGIYHVIRRFEILEETPTKRDANGNRVYSPNGSYTRPDASYVIDGKRYNTNYVSNNSLDNIEELNRELEAFQRMIDADPDAVNRLVFQY